MQAREVLVGQLQQMVQRQPLGEFAEFVALGGADQAVEVLPQIAVAGLFGDLLQQGLLAAAALSVIVQAGALRAQAFGQGAALAVQRLQLLGDGGRRLFGQRLFCELLVALLGFAEQRVAALYGLFELGLQLCDALLLGRWQQGLLIGGHAGKRAGLQGGFPGGLRLVARMLQSGQAALRLFELALQMGQLLAAVLDFFGAFGQADSCSRCLAWRVCQMLQLCSPLLP